MPSASHPDRAACPGCGKPATPAFKPFCGRGCRDRDLIQWLSDGYRIPGRPVEADEQDSDRNGLDS
ncbi:DNA gyrase inhibitor YacG [uncultured Sphingomonas sp.]|uniref:DNA gyrase inhibitor YacG n=1 Tax=uncultured Sphingomonas sp. TaxID=158754 RepID=UPI0025E6A279|nr:DNA gyrase inhibitor YacG [uncultured Sphingomonas sp.]